MKLLLDIGNTRIKWAYQSDADDCMRLEQPGEFVHRGKSQNEMRDWLAQLPVRPQTAAAVNVAGQALEDIVLDALSAQHGIAVQRLRTTAEWGAVRNGYTDCSQLGADRWAAIVGAWQQHRTDLCVVDAGTAVTVDLVRADGQHLGGVILAGRELACAALRGETADIGAFARGAAGPGDVDWFGRSTFEAISRGATFSLCAAIERAAARFPASKQRRDTAPRVILTGGDASELHRGLNIAADIQPLLVLEGLACLASDA